MSQSIDTPAVTTADEHSAPPARTGGPGQFAGMVGSSIAAKNSTDWVLHFLNSAYYAKSEDERDLDDRQDPADACHVLQPFG